MKSRSTSHVPALASKPYKVGPTTLILLPGSYRLFHRMQALAKRLAETDTAKEAFLQWGEIHLALALALTWDDPAFELETPLPARIDGLAQEEILALATDIMDELEAPAIRAILPAHELAQASTYALMGAPDQSGEEEETPADPLSTSSSGSSSTS